jgi:predicted amidohydrolase YtcJ
VTQSFDLIINGNIITLNNQQPRVEAIGIKNHKITATGSLAAIDLGAAASTRVLDLKGMTILPGFIDTHTHLIATGITRTGVDLSSVKSIGEALAEIGKKVKVTPPGKWIFAWKFNRLNVDDKRFPDIKELDAISLKHPIFIQHYDTHFLMLNSVAFKLLGLSANTEGVVQDKHGEYTGLIKDPASTNLWYKIIGLADQQERLDALGTAIQEALKVGITTIHTKENIQDAILIRNNQDRFTARLKTLIFFHPLREEDIDIVLDAGFSGQKTCLATYADGSIEGHTAALFEPYTDDPGTLGMLYYSNDEMFRFIKKAHQVGMQLSIHAESDRSIEQVLQSYERVLEQYPRKNHRHRIEHLELPTLSQVKRVSRLRIALAMQPIFITVCEGPNLDYYRLLLGNERVKRAHIFRSILGEGILVAGGSDTPVTSINPLAGIHACVNHPLKEQRINVHEAIEMFTINGAKIGFEEDEKGSIEPGKLADFVVLSDDPYRVPKENIGDIKVEMTIVDGQVVYTR